VATIVKTHGPALLKVAQRVSLCPDDANDALQRALEIYLLRVHTLKPTSEAAWLRVVVRNEAIRIRQARVDSLPEQEIDPDREIADDRSVEELAAEHERVQRSAEALSHLKRDEATALLLKAGGSSYEQISEELAWSRTKVNRALAEGRARFFNVFRGIESGEQCQRFAPLLEQLAAGEIEAPQMMTLRPHLRHCRSCRATLRELHTSVLQRVALLLPIPALLRPSQLKAEIYNLLGRFGHSADPAMAGSAGSGGRGVGAVALIGLCLGGAGAGGYCVATGKLPDPVAIVRQEREAPRSAPAKVAGKPVARRAPAVAVAAPARVAEETPRAGRPRPAASRKRREPTRRPRRASEFAFETPAPAPSAPPLAVAPPPAAAPAPPAATGEFAFEQ
jgi:RNA polymerase sigma factor (sigma-70 family)